MRKKEPIRFYSQKSYEKHKKRQETKTKGIRGSPRHLCRSRKELERWQMSSIESTRHDSGHEAHEAQIESIIERESTEELEYVCGKLDQLSRKKILSIKKQLDTLEQICTDKQTLLNKLEDLDAKNEQLKNSNLGFH